MRIIKIAVVFCGILLVGCASLKPLADINTFKSKDWSVQSPKKGKLSVWPHLDLLKDTIPGTSLNRAYESIIKNKKIAPVVVAVLDSGIDINHEDLKEAIWTNPNEIPNNNIDDDKNGYVDDLHGWNFLGDAVRENYEFVRILKKEGGDPQIRARAEEKLADRLSQAKSLDYYAVLYKRFRHGDSLISKALAKSEYSLQDLENLNPKITDSLFLYVGMFKQIFSSQVTSVKESLPIEKIRKEIEETVDHYQNEVDNLLNIKLEGRVTGDDPDDFLQTQYGNNNVVGTDFKAARHGTHVAGIIAAKRDNGIGMNGVASNARIMVVRSVPDGDEYDKDVALSIRYAADNGAKVINCSFGKEFSPHFDKVQEAMKYAASKDVLLVISAGNEAYNLDEVVVYPKDYDDKGNEVSDNVITVGAIQYTNDEKLIAGFSNYGKTNVDIFAPGVEIWSTTPDNEYEYLDGTSMASPEVSGVAALIRGLYPKLTAPQVKKIILSSGLALEKSVLLNDIEMKLSDACKSGKIVNAYNALLMAKQVNKGRLKI